MIKIIAKLTKVERKSKQTNLVFVTKGLVSDLDEMHGLNCEGNLLFTADKVSQETQLIMRDTRIGIDENGKSKSKLVRGYLHEYWISNIENESFESFYNRQMDKWIKQIKDKL